MENWRRVVLAAMMGRRAGASAVSAEMNPRRYWRRAACRGVTAWGGVGGGDIMGHDRPAVGAAGEMMSMIPQLMRMANFRRAATARASTGGGSSYDNTGPHLSEGGFRLRVPTGSGSRSNTRSTAEQHTSRWPPGAKKSFAPWASCVDRPPGRRLPMEDSRPRGLCASTGPDHLGPRPLWTKKIHRRTPAPMKAYHRRCRRQILMAGRTHAWHHW